MNDKNYDRESDRNCSKKHLLPHPQTRLSVFLAAIILMGFLPYFTSNHRSEAEINTTVDFLKAGGYKEEYYTTGYYVEFASDTEKIIVEYMLEDAVEIYADTAIDTGTYSPQAAQSFAVFKQYGINFVTMPPDKIYEKLTQYGYNSYKVYQFRTTTLH
ncbi:MAG: hypothetical protein E7484_07465 [Ruminococcaceae bacterium]|nr:hypothetical protein [Oscillospiraceae bacterium]